jgi:hypothetical protein
MKDDITYEMSLDEMKALHTHHSDRAGERFMKLGLVDPIRPVDDDGTYYDGQLPSNLNSLSNAALGDVHEKHIAFMAWLEDKLTSQRCVERNAKELVKDVKSKVRLSHTGTVAAKEDKTQVDQRYQMVKAAHQEELELLERIESRFSSANKQQKLISRLITQKGIEVDMNRRDVNIRRKGQFRRDPWAEDDDR